MHPFYVIRAIGGGLFVLGAMVMAYNVYRTARGDIRTEVSYGAPQTVSA